MLPHKSLCDVCKRNIATVFVTRIVQNHSNKQRLCQYCAQRNAAENDWNKSLAPKIGDGSVPSNIALDDAVKELFQKMKNAETNGDSEPAFPQNLDFPVLSFEAHEDDAEDEADDEENAEFSDDELEDIFEQIESVLDEVLGDDNFHPDDGVLQPEPEPAREIVSARCPKCATTWDRLRQDGRVGCAQCYVAFHDRLIIVMEQMQHETHHTGKLPRAALKRQRRLEHLRTKRDHRLEMLQRRLKEAVAEEKYEDAVQLRDKIKIVSSTIVSSES